jgi:hypothetical protein
VFHPILLGWLLFAFTSLLEYPVSFAEAEDDTFCVAQSGGCTPEDLCGGQITNLLLLAVYNNIFYAVAALVYSFLLVKCPPYTFFHKVLISLFLIRCADSANEQVFIAIGVAMIALVGVLYWAPDMGSNVAFILVSAASIIPYYQEQYLYCILCVPFFLVDNLHWQILLLDFTCR